MFQQRRQIVSKLSEQRRIIVFILSAFKLLSRTSFLWEARPVTWLVTETVLYCSLELAIKKDSFSTLKTNPTCLWTEK